MNDDRPERTETLRPARTDTFEHTITGLLAKRANLFGEAERIRDRMAEIKNDIGAIDRVLGTLGYTGDLDAAMPRQKREVIFGARRTDPGHPERATPRFRAYVQPGDSAEPCRHEGRGCEGSRVRL